jgi:hypothetical protein
VVSASVVVGCEVQHDSEGFINGGGCGAKIPELASWVCVLG